MKLSAKIFYSIVGLAICSIIVAAQVLWVPVKGPRNYMNSHIPVRGCRIIEIGNNWKIKILNGRSAPVMTKYNDRDTLSILYGIHIGHFDQDFINQVTHSVVIKNDTLKLKDLDHKLSDCTIYLDTLISEIKIVGNSQLNLGYSTQQLDRQLVLQSNYLKLRAYDHASVFFEFTRANAIEIYGHDHAEIYYLYFPENDSSSINRIELHDYSRATIDGSLTLFNHSIKDQASLIYHEKFAASKNKIVSLKGEYDH